MKNYKRIISLTLIFLMAFSFTACKKKSVSYTKVEDDDPANYSIMILTDGTDDYHSTIDDGFNDATDELFGTSHISINEYHITDDLTLEDSVSYFKNCDPDIILAVGDESLEVASVLTSDVPIVACNVCDYQSLLSLKLDKDGAVIEDKDDSASDSDDSTSSNDTTSSDVTWDGYTKTNITGINCCPDMSQVYSEMIEATDNLNTVGLIYDADDDSAIYQNKILEKYISESGLQYKEYPINFSSNMSEAARKSLVQSTAYTACSQCDSLYISAKSNLVNEVSTIETVANSTGTTTVGGDYIVGAHTLVSVFYDPYAQGYASAKLVYRILRNDEKAEDIAVSNLADETFQKLYNGSDAKVFGKTFPKSFQEITDFLKNYEYGSKVTKLDLSTDED